MRRRSRKGTELTEGQKLYDSINPISTDNTNEIINAAFKVNSTESIEEFLAGIVAGFLTGYKKPLEPFVEKVKSALAAFGEVTNKLDELRTTLRENKEGKAPKVKKEKL